jgi:tetratricopeptide (TPR) repeat protein
MKTSTLIFSILSVLVILFLTTGFQCSSAESTSAKLYIARAEWANAEAALVKEVEKNADNAEAWYLLGDVRRQRSNFTGMVEAFDRSLKVSNEFAENIRLTKLNIWGTSLNQGVNLYNQSINLSPDSASVLRKKAIELYTTALLVNPDSLITYKNMVFAQRAEKHIEEELRYLKTAISKKDDQELRIELINTYIRKATDAKANGDAATASDNFSLAIQELNTARKADPANVELLGTVINLYIETGKSADAIPMMEEYLKNDPDNKVFQNNLGLLLMQVGQKQGNDEEKESVEQLKSMIERLTKATDHFDAAVKTDSSYEDGLWNGAVAYMRLGEKMKKLAEATADPKNKEKSDKSYVQKFLVAITLTERLTSIKPDDTRYWTGLGTAYANAGKAKEAQAAFNKADKIGKNN